ncbi:hypothetical protein N9R73_00130 [Candidatus Pelagibacter sp.]|nr:hypothetical protein [Candidatus Pelagibacter sp.]|tara:strand:- start:741 stop:938 length:198 start_codon:yes stop_codon:yes gene_type:complete
MAIVKSEKIEIEIQKQVMADAGCKYMVLVKSENDNKNKLKILTTDIEPIVKFSEDNGRIVVVKKN